MLSDGPWRAEGPGAGRAAWIGSVDAAGAPPAAADRRVRRPPRRRLRGRVAPRAAPVLHRPLRPFLHARGAAHARVDVLLLADPAAVRALVGPRRGDLAAAHGGRGGGDRYRARR